MPTPALKLSTPQVRSFPPASNDDARFKHLEDLQEALEEYAAFHDGTIRPEVRPLNSPRSRVANG
jgi:hypothetical protein